MNNGIFIGVLGRDFLFTDTYVLLRQRGVKFDPSLLLFVKLIYSDIFINIGNFINLHFCN